MLGKVSAPLVDAENTLAMFGETRRTARQSYVRAMKAEREQEWLTEMPGRLPWWKREPDTPVEPPRPSAWIDERGVNARGPRGGPFDRAVPPRHGRSSDRGGVAP